MDGVTETSALPTLTAVPKVACIRLVPTKSANQLLAGIITSSARQMVIAGAVKDYHVKVADAKNALPT
jgi:hypothetical protein